MAEKREDIAECKAVDSSEIESSPLSEQVVSAMRLMGKTAAIGTNAWESVARGASIALAYPLRLCGFVGEAGATGAMNGLGVEIRNIDRQIDELCLAIGRRICDLSKPEIGEVVKDTKIMDIIASIRVCREKIMELDRKKNHGATELEKPEDAKLDVDKSRSGEEQEEPLDKESGT